MESENIVTVICIGCDNILNTHETAYKDTPNALNHFYQPVWELNEG